MRRRILWFAIVWAMMPAVHASDLTDAMVDVDPRSRLKSGTGEAYGSVYGPQEQAPPAEEELDPTQVPSLRGRPHYDRSFDGLQSPLYGSDKDNTQAPVDDSRSTTVTPEPIGNPYARPGVWYQDDLDRARR